MGVGVVVRDCGGQVVAAALGTVIPFIIDPSTTEALGAWRVVSLCREIGYSKLVLEGDYSVVVSALKV
jgi:hypothetical protein